MANPESLYFIPQSFLPLTDRFLGHRLEGRVSMDNKTGRSNRRLQVASNRRNSKLHMLQALVQDVQAQLNPWTFFVWDPRSCEQSLCHYMDLMIYHIYGDSIPVMIYMVIQSRFYLSSERPNDHSTCHQSSAEPPPTSPEF